MVPVGLTSVRSAGFEAQVHLTMPKRPGGGRGSAECRMALRRPCAGTAESRRAIGHRSNQMGRLWWPLRGGEAPGRARAEWVGQVDGRGHGRCRWWRRIGGRLCRTKSTPDQDAPDQGGASQPSCWRYHRHSPILRAASAFTLAIRIETARSAVASDGILSRRRTTRHRGVVFARRSQHDEKPSIRPKAQAHVGRPRAIRIPAGNAGSRDVSLIASGNVATAGVCEWARQVEW